MTDDELNILPISSHIRSIQKIVNAPAKTPQQKELEELKSSLEGTEMIGALIGKTKTLDQAKALLVFIEAISEKTLRSTVALTAARGRGKSASLGLAVACAIGMGYSNIFVTSPHPENLKTFFDFLFKGFDALSYQEQVGHRSFFVVVGSQVDQVVTLHYLLSQAAVKARPSVLWCYSKELGFSINKKKRIKKMKRGVARGLIDPGK